MKIVVPKERKERERRVALTPPIIETLLAKGFECFVEEDAGFESAYSNRFYRAAGATLITSAKEIYSIGDVVLKVNPPTLEEISLMKKGCVLISFILPMINPGVVEACAQYHISCFSMEAIPRITRAQKMDALSSQTNLAAYKAVIIAADNIGKAFPLMMTAAGTIKPVKVLVFGAGVAGLQAAATARRLGAIVEVTDVRPETKEQVESLGAKFIDVAAESGLKTSGGYVKEVSNEYIEKQRAILTKHVAESDIVITTALVPGKKAPTLVTKEMVRNMRLGSVIVDMAVEQGGNCELSELNKIVVKEGVTIIGESKLASLLSLNSSQLYAKNISELLLHLATKDGFKWEMEEEITKCTLFTHKGEILKENLKSKIV